MKLRMLLAGFLACGLAGCVTVSGGATYGVPVDAANRPQPNAAPAPLLVSATEVSGYSTPYLGLIAVTFENNTRVWKQVDHVTLDFGSPVKNQSVTIAPQADVVDWERSAGVRHLSRDTYADQQLLAPPFRVPPGMSTTRWVLLYTSDYPPGGCIDSMILSYETSDHQTSRVLVPFKDVLSAWQVLVCGAPPTNTTNTPVGRYGHY